MTLIKSISGIRGTIGGQPGTNLTPIDIVKFTSAYGTWLKERAPEMPVVCIGRDARKSGEMVSGLVKYTLNGLGIRVIDLGLTTTPTVEVAVQNSADGGIILTASHNPHQWNALKLLNEKGEFISAVDGQKILDLAESKEINFASIESIGSTKELPSYHLQHIAEILELNLIDEKAIGQKNFRVVIDCVNSTGGITIPPLLKALNVVEVKELYCEPNGDFPHNPEPLPEHLTEICNEIKNGNYDVGFVVDPDVDRLAIIDENGVCIGEEYSLVLIADYVLSQTPGDVVSNMSSSSALSEIARKHGQKRFESAVGEVNVVTKMKEVNAVIGGEGNGGIIYPELHYGRDSLVGIGLFLTYLAKSGKKVSELRKKAPPSFIAKNKIELTPDINVDALLNDLANAHSEYEHTRIDGLKVYFPTGWIQIRKSNTEPIIRIYSESDSEQGAIQLFERVKSMISKLARL